MEPPPHQVTQRFLLGWFEVVQAHYADGITIDMGKGVFTTIYIGDFQHSVKPGDRLPLYTEIPYAASISPSIQ